MAPQSVDVKTVIITYQDKAPLTVVQPDDKTKDPTPHLTDSDLKGRSRHLQGGKIPSSVLEILANPILVEPMPNAPSRVTEQSVLVVPTPLVILTPIAKMILANNNLVPGTAPDIYTRLDDKLVLDWIKEVVEDVFNPLAAVQNSIRRLWVIRAMNDIIKW